jgi:hypothetical protein
LIVDADGDFRPMLPLQFALGAFDRHGASFDGDPHAVQDGYR